MVHTIVILTGRSIINGRRRGDIVIEPFSVKNVNPNSYNFHLYPSLLIRENRKWKSIALPKNGLVLSPNLLYLGATAEEIGSDLYVVTLLGKSSIGRLGIFLNSTADLGHLGCRSRWTLEISVVQAVRVYPGMCFGQVAFWRAGSRVSQRYAGRYFGDLDAVPNRDVSLLRA